MIAPEVAKSHHRTVVACGYRTLEAINNLEPLPGSSLSAERRRELLFMLHIDPETMRSSGNLTQISGKPTPGTYAVAQAFDEVGRRDTERRRKAISSFLTETLLPLAGIPFSPASNVTSTTDSYLRLRGCTDAENSFWDTYNQVSGAMPSNRKMQSILSVYYDQDGNLLALGKKRKEASSLLLAPIGIEDDVFLPAGTIVGIEHGGLKQAGRHDYGDWHAKAYLVAGQPHLQPIRLSAWAYDNPLDRTLFAVSRDSERYDDERAAIVTSLTLDDFRAVGAQILSDCGINNNLS